jgi:penicillin-binding protein 1A
VAAIWGSVALVLLIAWYAYDLPEFRTIKKMTRQPSVTILDREGASMANFGGLYGAPVTLESVPPVLPHAVLAVEDRRFYEHFGIDVKGLLRAATRNLFAGRIVQGGSTLSQQLAKNLFLSPDRTLRRKVQELLLAFWLEYKFSKDQILTIYLNRVYLGAGTYGVDAAARRYFGKSASEVTLYEAALLAGLLKAPSRLNPAEDADRAEERTALVLNSMVDAGFIERAEADLAVRTKTPQYLRTDSRAPYFADWIMAQVNDYLGAVDRDIVVVTTLDPRLQKVAEEELTSILEIEGIASKVSQAALVSLDPTGAVRAMVGGRDYDESQFNRASQALRQPGSAFKPFVYLAAIEGAGFLPDSRMLDAPVTLGKWQPKNYGGRYYGEVTLRESFARSLNSVSVRIMRTVGPDKVVEAARRLGITTPLDPTGGIALGASEVTLLELTGAYATFVNQGFGTWPYGVEEIRDAGGDVLYRRSPVGGPGQVVGAREAALVTHLMNAAVEWGTGKAAKLDRPAAGKTGTSQEFRDAWFVGFTAELVTGVWFGNDDNSAMKNVTGGSLPARLWGSYMHRGLAGRPPLPLPGSGIALAATAPEPVGRDDGFIGKILKGLRDETPSREDEEARIKRLFNQREDRR